MSCMSRQSTLIASRFASLSAQVHACGVQPLHVRQQSLCWRVVTTNGLSALGSCISDLPSRNSLQPGTPLCAGDNLLCVIVV